MRKKEEKSGTPKVLQFQIEQLEKLHNESLRNQQMQQYKNQQAQYNIKDWNHIYNNNYSSMSVDSINKSDLMQPGGKILVPEDKKGTNPTAIDFIIDEDSPVNERLFFIEHTCIKHELGSIIWRGLDDTFKNILPINCVCGTRITAEDIKGAWVKSQLKDIL